MKKRHLQEARRVAHMTGRRLRLRIPSILATGERFAMDLSVTGPDALPDEHFTNILRFEGSSGVEGLPGTFRFPPGKSTGRIRGLKAVGPEVVSIRAQVEGTGKEEGPPVITSNPAWVFDDPPYRLFWGDIHIHTKYSNCSAWRCLDPEWCYQYAQEISLLDFAAAADHLRGIVAEEARWPRLQELVRTYYQPGRFVTLLAFESSHALGYGGDNNVYYRDDEAPYFWVDREDMHGTRPEVHLRELWAQLDQNGKPYITIPHHTGRRRKYRTWDEDYYDPDREPLFEIYSSHGSSEMRWSRFPISQGNNDANGYFVDALKAGTRFGLIASSDDHATLPGNVHQFRVNPFCQPSMNGFPHKGLAAIRAPELTREALFEAMQLRQTYATTDSRSLIDVQIADAGMGQAITADGVLRQEREIRVTATLEYASAARFILMRNGEPCDHRDLQGPALSAEVNEVLFHDTDAFENVALRDTRFHPRPFVVYYVRVEDNLGFHQWSSPIWIDSP